MPDTAHESLVSRQMEIIVNKLDILLQGYGKLQNEIEHLSAAAEDNRSIGTRLTTVEVRADTNEKWISRNAENVRWLVGLTIVSLLAVLGIAIKVFTH